MKVLRFMSVNEIILLLKGKRLENNKNHHDAGNSTNSVGFCFSIINHNIDDEVAIFEAAKLLAGIATLDCVLVAELKKPSRHGFERTWGDYRVGRLEELSVRRYALEDFEDWRVYAPNDRYTIMPHGSYEYVNPQYVTQRKSW